MKVIKRNCELAEFDKDKIKKAILKAYKEVDGEITEEVKEVSKTISDTIKSKISTDDKTVEDIQNMVEEELMSNDRKDVAKAYLRYRYKREMSRERDNEYKLLAKRRMEVTVCENSNANVDELSFSGREKEAAADIFKKVNEEELPDFMIKAHKGMLIYQHDFEKALFGLHNCLNIDFPNLFKNGFSTRNGNVRPPATFSTACQLVAVVFQLQSQCQFGK